LVSNGLGLLGLSGPSPGKVIPSLVAGIKSVYSRSPHQKVQSNNLGKYEDDKEVTIFGKFCNPEIVKRALVVKLVVGQ